MFATTFGAIELLAAGAEQIGYYPTKAGVAGHGELVLLLPVVGDGLDQGDVDTAIAFVRERCRTIAFYANAASPGSEGYAWSYPVGDDEDNQVKDGKLGDW